MTQFEFDEFWKGLNRLYEASVQTREATERLAEIAKAHENRLDRIEVVQQWLAEKERKREIEEKGE